jgi:hypothetical protein
LESKKKELTWFTKGLRLFCFQGTLSLCSMKELTWFTKGLRRNSISCLTLLRLSRYWKELTWFTKGLRQKIIFPHNSPLWLCPLKELTWFTKGLRPIARGLTLNFSAIWRNWPDLRRDYDVL